MFLSACPAFDHNIAFFSKLSQSNVTVRSVIYSVFASRVSEDAVVRLHFAIFLQENWTATFYLYDAVYLYLRTVNQTLDEGYPDYRAGRFIRNRTIGQRFVGRSPSKTYS